MEGTIYNNLTSGSENISGSFLQGGRFDIATRSNFFIHGIFMGNPTTGDWSQVNGNTTKKGSFSIRQK